MADSEVRQKECTILETERLIRKIAACEGMPAKLILMRHFYESAYATGMRAGEIAQREQSVFLAAKLLPAHMAKRLIAALPLPAAPEEK